MKTLKNIAEKKFHNVFHASLLGLVVFGFAMISISIAEIRSDYNNRIIKVSKQISTNIENDIEEISLQILLLASEIKNSKHNKKIFKLIRSFSNIHNSSSPSLLNWNSYSWINKYDKIVIDGKFGIIKNKQDLSKRDYIRFTKFNPDKVIIGDAVYGALTQRLIIPIALGVFNKKSQYIGTIVYGYDTQKAAKQIKEKIDHELYKFIIFKNDEVLFSSDDISNDFQEKIKDKIKLISLSEKEVSKKITSQGLLFGDNFNSYYIKQKNSSIGVVVIIDDYKFYKLIINDIIKNLTTILIIALLFFFLFKILYQRIISPISYLTHYAKNIASKNFEIKMQRPENDELHEIFNYLSEISEKFKKEESTTKQLASINKKITMENLAKSQFFEAICHDIREPLFSIMKEVKKNEQKSSDDNMNKELYTLVNEALQITDDLVDISQTSSGLFINNKKINPLEEINKSIKIVSSTAHQNKIKIELKKNQQNIKKISTDPKRLRQIMINIFIKVIAISKAGEKIFIDCEEVVKNNKKILHISINSIFSHKIAQLAKNNNIEASKKDIQENVVDHSFDQFKELISKMDGKLEIEQRNNDHFKILISFSY